MNCKKKTDSEPLTTKQAAEKAGVGIETLRFYEREGLIEAPSRTQSGYRQFTPEIIQRILFIKRAQSLGFTLAETQELLSLSIAPNTSRSDVWEKTKAKIEDIDEKIQGLQRMKDVLMNLANACAGHGSIVDCPIIETLENGSNHPKHKEGYR